MEACAAPGAGRVVVWLVLAAALCAGAAVSAETTNAAPLAVWDTTIRATVGGGYRENVLLSSVAPEGSPLFISSADASFIRLTEDNRQLVLFLLGEDLRYTDSPSVGREQLFSGSAEYVTPLGKHDELGGQFLGLYQYQVLDVSDTETNLQRVLVEGYGLSLQPHWKHTLGRGWSVQLEGTMYRQFYVRELDDFWEGAGRLSFIYGYGRRSEFAVGFQSLHRLYDTRVQFNRAGTVLTNTSLIYWRPEVSAQWRHYWDAGRHWRTTVKTGFLFNRDNGSGYFDYDRILFAGQLRWRNYGWEAKAGARLGWYFYRVQPGGDGHRERSYYVLNARVERRLGKYWLLYAATEREWNLSNEPLDQYNDWLSSAGVGVEF